MYMHEVILRNPEVRRATGWLYLEGATTYEQERVRRAVVMPHFRGLEYIAMARNGAWHERAKQSLFATCSLT